MATLIFFQVKTLAFQNQKLGHRLTQRIAMEEDLRSRIDQVCALYSYYFFLLLALYLGCSIAVGEAADTGRRSHKHHSQILESAQRGHKVTIS